MRFTKISSSTNISNINSSYAGSESCRNCHSGAYSDWKKSHHAKAERLVSWETETTVFDPSRTFHHGTQTTEVYRTNDHAEIVTKGFGGRREAYRVSRVLGDEPLRQFLTESPGGRFQVHEASYDPGSNQWFNVYGAEDRQPGEWGHWTGRGMNWNSMCATCHNTRLQKGYNEINDTFHTTMAEMSVGCEGCHGPMKAHVDWSNLHKGAKESDPNLHKLSRIQVLDTCGSCHARRGELSGDFKPGDKFNDCFNLVMVDGTEIFYPDGQIHDEDYEYNAFLGSRMHDAGVSCSDCHNAHTSKTILPGNFLCLKCHAGGMTNAPVINPVTHSHHNVYGFDSVGHPTNSDLTMYQPKVIKETGGECVNCHMPQTVYMQRHWRHDHGFTIPDPQLTKEFNIPNACNRCHKDKDNEWSIMAVKKWYGDKINRPSQKRSRLMAQAREGNRLVIEPLLRLISTNESPYWKAVSAGFLSQWAQEPEVIPVLTNLLNHEDSLVRAKAVLSLAPLSGNHIKGLDEALKKCLLDPVRNVRYEAGWALRENVETNSTAGLEMLQTIGNFSEQPAGQVQVALWDLAHGQTDSALAHYSKAISWDPYSPPIRIDYAVALSSAGQSSNALVQIKEACRLAPNDADNFFRLGLVWNEVGDLDRSINALQEAARLNPRHDRALYNLGLAYGQSGDFVKAIESLTLAEAANRLDSRAGYAKATIFARMGRTADAIAALRSVLKIQPDFPEAQSLLRSLTP